jgi:hypothetical protein
MLDRRHHTEVCCPCFGRTGELCCGAPVLHLLDGMLPSSSIVVPHTCGNQTSCQVSLALKVPVLSGTPAHLIAQLHP